MNFTSPEFIIAIATIGFGGFGVALLTIRPTRKKLAAEAQKLAGENMQVITSTAVSLIDPLKEEIAELRKDSEKQDTLLSEMRRDLLEMARAMKPFIPEIAQKYIDKYDVF